jgi:hypothetical protein
MAFVAEPRIRLLPGNAAEEDVGGTATRSRNGGVKVAELLVRCYEHENAQTLSDQSVDDV